MKSEYATTLVTRIPALHVPENDLKYTAKLADSFHEGTFQLSQGTYHCKNVFSRLEVQILRLRNLNILAELQ